jgi:hypothetical protein
MPYLVKGFRRKKSRIPKIISAHHPVDFSRCLCYTYQEPKRVASRKKPEEGMPTPKKSGRRRIEIVAESDWIEDMTRAAKQADQSLSAFFRTAANQRVVRENLLGDEKLHEELKNERGRPRKPAPGP